MSDNPYQATKLTEFSSPAGEADPTLDRAVSMLSQTKPWVRFISVMMFLGCGFMVLGGVGLIIGSAAGGFGMPGVTGFIIGGVYIVMALFYIVPAIFLWMYADRIKLFVQERSTGTLASALEAQKSFWKFVGIIMLIVIAIYAVIFVFALVGGVVASM